MNIDKTLIYKKQLQKSFERGLISKKKYKKELNWIKNFNQSK